jgi:hypothetical protein
MSRQLRAGFNTRPSEDGDAPIIDSLNSDRPGSALSARQGRILSESLQTTGARVNALSLKALTISAPAIEDKVPLFFAGEAVTLRRLTSIVAGSDSPSVSFALRYGADFSEPGVDVVVGGVSANSTTTGVDLSAFDNPVIPPGAWLWLLVTGVEGSVSAFNATLAF